MAARGANARKKAKRRRHAKSRKAAMEAAAAASQDRAQPRSRKAFGEESKQLA